MESNEKLKGDCKTVFIGIRESEFILNMKQFEMETVKGMTLFLRWYFL
jgi:hypothetical protein